MLSLLRKIFGWKDDIKSNEDARYSCFRQMKPMHVHEIVDLVKEINILQKELYSLDRGKTCVLSDYRDLLDGDVETISKTRCVSVEGSRTKMKVPRRTWYTEPVKGGYHAFKKEGSRAYTACVVVDPTTPFRYNEKIDSGDLIENERIAVVLVFEKKGEVGRVVKWREVAKDVLEPITTGWAYADVSLLPELIIHKKDETVSSAANEDTGGAHDRSAATRW